MLNRAVVRMDQAHVRQLSVVERGGRRFLGIITMSDIVRARVEAINESNQLERTQVPDFAETREGISKPAVRD